MPDLDSEMATPPTALERAQIAHVDLLDIASAIKCGVYEERLRGLDRLQTASHAFTAHLGAALAEVDRLTTQAALDAAALTTPEVYVGVVSAAVEEEIGRLRRQRDEALADLAALRLEHEAHKILLTCARRECDDARDETTRLWDATEADRARMAELESRPTYEDGIKAAAAVMRAATVDSADSVVAVVDAIFPRVLALLEPKP